MELEGGGMSTVWKTKEAKGEASDVGWVGMESRKMEEKFSSLSLPMRGKRSWGGGIEGCE